MRKVGGIYVPDRRVVCNRREFIAKLATLAVITASKSRAATTLAGKASLAGSATLGPSRQENHSDLIAFNPPYFVYSVTNPFVVGNSVLKHLHVTGGAGWTPGNYVVEGFIPNFDTVDGAQNLIQLASAPAAELARGGKGWVDTGIQRVICVGDSLTKGIGAGPYVDNYPWQMMDLLGQFDNFRVYEKGVDGRPISNPGNTPGCMIGDYPTEIAPLYSAAFDPVLMPWGGSNDLGFGEDGADTYADLVTYCNLARATGFTKIVVCPVLTRTATPPGFQTERGIFNGLLSAAFNVATSHPRIFRPAGGTTFADLFCNFSLNASLQNFNDTTYFNADKVHLVRLGYGVVAGDMAACPALLAA